MVARNQLVQAIKFDRCGAVRAFDWFEVHGKIAMRLVADLDLANAASI